MKTYEYRGFLGDGHATKGLIEAMTMKEARARLMGEGVFPDRIVSTRKNIRFSGERRATVYRELGALLEAGLPIVRALDVLIESPELDESHILLAGIRDRVREGVALADAFAEASRSVTPFEQAIIQAGERSATVEHMLDRLAAFIEERERIRERVQGALIYPAIVFTVGVCVAVLMLGILVPRAAELLQQAGQELHLLTRAMMAFGRGVIRYGWLVVLLLAAAGFTMYAKAQRDAELRIRWDRICFSLPLIGRGYALLSGLHFSRTLAILLNGGVTVIEGLRMAGRATGSPWVVALSDREAEAVQHGGALSEGVRRIPPLAGSLPGWIQTGEATGALPAMLERAARRYQDRWDRYIVRCLAFLEPVLILVIGGFVLLVTLSVLLPVLSLSQSVVR